MSENAWVVPLILQGERIRLEPLAAHHAAGLSDAASDELFRFFAGYKPEHGDIGATEAYIDNVNSQPDKVAFAIVDQSSGRAIGATSYMEIRSSHRGLEIGSTWLGALHQGSAANPEAKLLLLRHAFEVLGAVRVQFRTDMRNLHSQKAIEKLGAVKEGILRKHTIMSDGFIRDSVYYSIVADDWPVVSSRLRKRLISLGLPHYTLD